MNAQSKPPLNRLLVIAADAGFRDASAAIAERLGYELYSTGYPEDFGTIVADLAPSVIVLDIDLFGSLREEALGRLARIQPPPAVLLLAAADRHDGITVRDLAASYGLKVPDVFLQPVDLHRLETTLQSLRSTG